MKPIDNKGRLFGKINLIDLAVLLLLIFAVAVTGVKIAQSKTDTADGNDATLRYTLYIRGLREVSVNALLAETETIIDAEYGGEVGCIVGDIVKVPATDNVLLENGTYTTVTYDDRYDLYITLETPVIETETGLFTADDRRMYFGGTLGINNGHVETFGEIIDLELMN